MVGRLDVFVYLWLVRSLVNVDPFDHACVCKVVNCAFMWSWVVALELVICSVVVELVGWFVPEVDLIVVFVRLLVEWIAFIVVGFIDFVLVCDWLTAFDVINVGGTDCIIYDVFVVYCA